MGDWDNLYCHKHPDRVSLERCEVCDRPLCAYCLYYTEDGQRLCKEHAALARLNGVRIEEPGAYAEQLVGAQAGVVRKQKRGYDSDATLYRGNSTDLMGFIGLLVGVITLGSLCGATLCLPLVGFVMSLVAVINARNAYDPGRTRRFGVIGVLVSGVWIAGILLCIFAVLLPLNTVSTTGPVVVPPPGNLPATLNAPFNTSTPLPTQTPTPLPHDDAADVSASFDPVP